MNKKTKPVAAIVLMVLLLLIIAVFVVLGINKAKGAFDAVNTASANKKNNTIQSNTDEVFDDGAENPVQPADSENQEETHSAVLNEEISEGQQQEQNQTSGMVDEKEGNTGVVDIDEIWADNRERYIDFSRLSLPDDFERWAMPEDFLWYDEFVPDSEGPENCVAADSQEVYGEYKGVIVSLIDFTVYDFARVVFEQGAKDVGEVQGDNAKLTFETLYCTNIFTNTPEITEGVVKSFEGEMTDNVFVFPFIDDLSLSMSFYSDGEKVYAKGSFYGGYPDKPEYVVLLTKSISDI